MPGLLIAAIVLVAAFLQCLTGFGFALIVMPVATVILGVRTAAPTVAAVALTVYSVNLVRYRRGIKWREVLRLGIASAAGVPVGIWLLSNADEQLVMRVLGLVLVAYALYSLAQPKVSRVLSRGWVYPAGCLAGCSGGAYNTPGPPVTLYGRIWMRMAYRMLVNRA